MIRINQNHKYCDSTGFQKGFVLFISYLVFSVLLCDVYVCRVSANIVVYVFGYLGFLFTD